MPVWLVTYVDQHRTARVQAMLSCLKAARTRAIKLVLNGAV